MAFSLFEIGNTTGRPVHLYEFTWGTTVWRYTSADREIEWPEGLDPPQLWSPVAISDNGVVQGGSATDFQVTIPANLPVVDLYRTTPPAESIWVRVRRYHWDDPDEQGTVYWVGTIGNVKRKTRAEAVVFGLPLSATIRRTGLRLCWERNCPHMLYDQDCKVDREMFKNETTITALTGNTITVAGLGLWTGPQYAGGFFEWEPTGATAGTIERRGIEAHIAGNQFQVFGTTDRLENGENVTLYLGCDLVDTTCDDTFDNLVNHGGYKFMPGKSPFDGDPVF